MSLTSWKPGEPHFKVGRTEMKRQKLKTRSERRTVERDAKKDSKKRDRHRCRFPRCRCHKLGLRLESSHREHKGMGGDPRGLTNVTSNLMTVCTHRHKDSPVSIDKGGLRWIPLTERGADGPVRWEVNLEALPGWTGPSEGGIWRPVFIERSIGIGDVPDDWALDVLDELESCTY